MKGVLFLCRANSCRSQMAEGIARQLLPPAIAVFSAGSRPDRVNPRAVAALRETGIDISHHHSKSLDEIPADAVDVVITLCAEGEEDCPYFAGEAMRLHWPLPDPAAAAGTHDESLRVFREVRDELVHRIGDLAAVISDAD